MKKKSIKRLLAVVVALLLIFMVGSTANSLVGNPISKWLAKKSATNYIAEYYSENDYVVGKVGYNFKFKEYCVSVTSPSSPDSAFTIYTDRNGDYQYDSYESDVVHRMNTWGRLEKELKEQAELILTKELDYEFESVSLWFNKEANYMGQLMLDEKLDIQNPSLPLELYVNILTNQVTWDKMEEVSLSMEEVLLEYKIPVEEYSVILIPKENQNDLGYGTSWVNSLYLSNFPAERLKEDDLSQVMKTYQEDYENEMNQVKDKEKEMELYNQDVEILLDKMKKETGEK